ncbi:hypothetical protein [Pseudomonas viridiflava]|uniref:hypothetical protein n=1 Tax=Pseudomonas viridiflava TaxID=33069 RepID=UPI000F012BD0|nr:hypothetical protein [Pseudomonas viridiflava]
MSSPLTATHEIRYLEEIKSLFAIDFDFLLSKETYSRPLRSYHLIKSEAQCQFIKKGHRCGQEHSHGFAVECKGGQRVLIGNCCAFNHLGLDDDQVGKALRELNSAERISIREYKIGERLNEKAELLARVKNALKDLRQLEAALYRIRNEFPDQVFENLVERWRRNSLQVTWEYQITKRDEKAKGKDAIERKWYPHICGFIKGLGLWMDLEAQNYQQKLYAFLHRVEAIPTKKRLSKAEQKETEAIFRELGAIAVIEREFGTQQRLIADFLEPSNLVLTIQLVKTQTLRANNVEAVQRLTSTLLGVRPDRVVAEVDQDLIRRYGATGLRIAS